MSIGIRTPTRAPLLWICAGAVVLRLLAIVVLGAWRAPDAMESGQIARDVVAGLGFVWTDFDYSGPTSIQSPTYPYLLAGLFQLFGSESALAYGVALVLNALLGFPAAWGLARLTRELGAREHEALAAAALFAVWPTQIYSATHAQAIALITTCVIWMVACFLASERERGLRAWLGFCLAAMLGALTEPTLLPIALLSLPWMWLRTREPRACIARSALWLVCAALLLGPWTARNLSVHGTFVLVKSGFWVNVWKGANDYATGTDRMRLPPSEGEAADAGWLSLRDARGETGEPPHQYDALRPEERAALEGRTEIERERIFRGYVLRWIQENPGRFVELCGIRLWKTLWADLDNPKAAHPLYLLSRAALLLLAVPGLALALARRWRLLYPAALFASCVGVYTLTLTAARFAFPLEPLQLALAAATLGWLTDRLRPAATSARS